MKVLVIGCARSGYYAALLLNKMGHEVVITDKNEILPKLELIEKGIEVYDLGHPDHLKEIKWDFIVKNPGIPYHVPFVKYFNDLNIKIYNEFEIGLQYSTDFSLAAITGTNGKTTTTTLLYEILKKQSIQALVGGNIGTAFCELVYKHLNEEANVAIEISAFQLIATPSFHPVVSTILNLTPDHLDYFDSLEDYYKAKTLVYNNQVDDDWFILNLDDEMVVKYATDIKCKVITFSLNTTNADLRVEDNCVYLFDTVLFKCDTLRLVGRHNLSNAMVAACMAFKMGVEPHLIQEAILEFKGVEHRIEYVNTIQGVKYYNDSKATNTDSTIAALKSFEHSVILLAGGYDKKTGFKELEPYVDRMKHLIVYGATKHELRTLKENAIVVDDLKQAVEKAHLLAQENDVVLFSPACASYDQFNNFEERGNIFKEYVNSFNK